MHNPICLHTSIVRIKERHNQEHFRLPFRLEQIKPLKLLSHLVPHLSAFLISDNYPLPSTQTYSTIQGGITELVTISPNL